MNQHFTTLQTHFDTWLKTLGFSSSVQYQYPQMLGYFFRYLEERGICNAQQLSSEIIYQYFDYLERTTGKLTRKAFSPAYLNKNFDAVDKFLEFLQQMGMQDIPSPTKYRILNPYQANFTVLSTQEISQLYEAIPNTFQNYGLATREPRQAILTLVLDLCYGCGLRRSELTNLQLNDVKLDRKVLHIRQAKGYKDRYVPFSQAIYKNLQLFIYQYRSYWNRRPQMLFPYCSHFVARCIKILQRESNNDLIKAKQISPHSLRHSIATHLLENGMDIKKIARFLGHDSLESTQIYAHINEEL